MDFTRLRVLVMDGGGKQTLAMVRGLKDIGCHVTVLCSTKMDTCYVSNKPDERIVNPNLPERNEETLKFLLKLVSTGKYDALMPIGELSTNFVTEHEAGFSKYVKLACAPRDTYIKAFNKQITFDTAIENNIPCPYTRHSKQSIEDYLETCTFPIIIKPRQGLGSIGFHKFEKREDFWPYMQEHNLNPDDYVVQGFVDYEDRVSANIFVDQRGYICTSYAVDALRWFPIDAGAGVLSETLDAHEVLEAAGKLLQKLGWKGFAQVAFMMDKKSGEPRLQEINGRIPASIKMAYMLGYNISQQMLEMAYEEDVVRYPENDKFGMYIRHFDTDLAWFFKSPNRFKAKPSWFSWKNTQEVLYSRDDRKPFWSHLLRKIFKYKEIMERKKH